MSSNLLPKNIDGLELLEKQNSSIALTDENLVVIWYNQNFKNNCSANRIKGVNLNTLFGVRLPENFEEKLPNKSFVIPHPDTGNNLVITRLKSDKKGSGKGFLVELVPIVDKSLDHHDKKLLQQSIRFQTELQNVLVLLVKENQLSLVAEEILTRCVELTASDLGIIVFQDDNEIKDFLYSDVEKIIKNRSDVEKSITHDSSFVNKWLGINRRPLLAINQFNNIGFGITQVLDIESACISPCFFEDKLLAKLLVAKKEGSYSSIEINIIEQFSTLLSFAISNIKTRELNNALESRLLQAQKLETIGKLSSGMAHDFGNILSSIFGSINLLRNRVPDTENVARLIDNIETCSVRARDLTKGLLSFGKPTAKRKELVLLNFLLDELIKVIGQTFPRNLTFATSVGKNLYNILGNATEIYQILLNLCVNAQEAIDGRGEIKLSAKNITIDDSNIMMYPLLSRGNYVMLSVSDSGVGINEEDISKIFDPYFSTKQKETGSGLGLYVSYGIIKAHNGHIEVSSIKRKGTTFDVFLPAYEPHKVDKTSIANKIILLADDEIMLSDLLTELLELNGYNVIKVSSGEEVIKVLTEEIKADLLIIDYNMPAMNGLECIAEIRRLEFDMPIILSSGSLKIEETDIDEHKINGKLAKPYDFETMLSTIQKLI